MLRLSGNILLSLDYASQEQMDSYVYFLMSELKEHVNSNDKPIEIFVNNSKRITALHFILYLFRFISFYHLNSFVSRLSYPTFHYFL